MIEVSDIAITIDKQILNLSVNGRGISGIDVLDRVSEKGYQLLHCCGRKKVSPLRRYQR